MNLFLMIQKRFPFSVPYPTSSTPCVILVELQIASEGSNIPELYIFNPFPTPTPMTTGPSLSRESMIACSLLSNSLCVNLKAAQSSALWGCRVLALVLDRATLVLEDKTERHVDKSQIDKPLLDNWINNR